MKVRKMSKHFGRTLSRRSALAAFGIAASLPLLAACSQTVTPPGQSAPSGATQTASTAAPENKPVAAGSNTTSTGGAGKTTLKVWTWTSVENMPAWTKARDGLQAKNPDLAIDLQHLPSSEYWDKVTVGYAGGDIADVLYLPPNNCQDLGSKAVLLDLKPTVDAEKFNLDDITPSTQKPYMWGGKIYAINAMNDTSFIVYNVELFEKAGLPTNLPETWDGDFSLDQFVEYGKKLTEPSSQQWGFILPNDDLHSVFMLGGKLWDDDSYPMKSALDSAASIAGLQFMHDLVYKHKIAPAPAAMTGMGNSDDVFKTGKVGMVFARNKNLTGIFKPVKFKYAATTFPKDPNNPRRTDIGINGFGTVSKSKVPDAAWKYIKWMTAEDGNALLLGLTSLPANKNVDPYKVSPLEKWQVKLTLDGLAEGWLSSPHPNVRRKMFDEINQELDQLLLDKKAAADTGKAAAERVNKIFTDLGPAVPK